MSASLEETDYVLLALMVVDLSLCLEVQILPLLLVVCVAANQPVLFAPM